MKRLTLAFLGFAAALVLSGCGIRGDLERPPPFWGADERTADERAFESEETTQETEAEPTASEQTP
ncbi:lipoprotein [Oceanicaulis alexandrii]|uniref:LPS translocon maturation chaperone LptM n=1 Tax=Oceanicaulis alexandrii TaxID=153233 RepID=UPI0035CF26CE